MTMGFNAQASSHADDQGPAAGEEMILIQRLKAAFDKVTALLAVVALAPLFGLVALAIKINGWRQCWYLDEAPPAGVNGAGAGTQR